MNNLRKILSIALCIAMLAGSLPMAAAEEALLFSLTDGEIVSVSEPEDAPVCIAVEEFTGEVSGEETLPEEEPVTEEPASDDEEDEDDDSGLLDIKASDYEVVDGVLLYYTGTASSFTIPAGVTAIADSAFANCASLTSVTIPASVTAIGEGAFYGTGLTRVTIPSGVAKIAAFTFASCESLTDVTIPTSVTVIEQGAFSGCSALASVTIPASVTRIGVAAFSGCSILTAFAIPAGVTEIADSTFMSCYALANVTIPASVTKIGAKAFYECAVLTDVVLPMGIHTIGENAFAACDALEDITIPASVTSIGANAFNNCEGLTIHVDAGSAAYTYCVNNAAAQGFSYQLTSIPAEFTVSNGTLTAYTGSAANVIIPDAVTAIGAEAFHNNTSMQSVEIPDSVTSIGADAFSGCTNLSGVEIPSSVTSIGSGAFNDCDSLTTVSIPASVTSIGAGAFADCDDLTAINVAEGNTAYASADGVLYNANMTTLICYPAGKQDATFTVPSTVTTVADNAFAGASGVTIYVYENSAAHQYMIANAAAQGLTYEVLPAPAAPVTLPRPTMGAHTVISSLKLKLTWNAVEGAQGYELWRSDAANGTYTKVADTTALEKVDDCIFGKINYYKVRAYADVNGQRIYSAYSLYRSSFGLATPGIQKVEMAANGVKITAKTVANATGYYIYRCETINGLYTRLGTTTLANGENYFMDTTAVNGKTYYYKARAYHTSYTNVAEGVTYVGPFSVAKNIAVNYPAPARVVMGPHTVISSLDLKLTWNAVSGADGYELWRSDAADGTYTKVADVTSLQHTDRCIFGKINYYKCRAYYNINGQKIYGQFSVYRSSFGLATPGIQTLTSTSQGIKITHASVANATGYYISRGESPNGPFTRIGQSSVVNGVNTFVDTTAVPGKTYYYRCNVYHISYTYVSTGVTYVGPLSVAKPCTR